MAAVSHVPIESKTQAAPDSGQAESDRTGERMIAIIPAAGLGTRFLPITKSQPKEMLPVLRKPVIQ